MVTVLPLTVATAGLLLVYDTAKPLLAVALRVNGASPKVLAARAPKVMVWLAWLTARVCGTAVAAL